MKFISTLISRQYDSNTGELVVRDGTDCNCIGYTTTVENPDLVHTINLPRPVDIMVTQIYEYSFGSENKAKLVIPEKIQYGDASVTVTFGEEIKAVVRFNIMYVCGYEYQSSEDTP